MSGRDPHEPHRVATPLELLFDLTFVIPQVFSSIADDEHVNNRALVAGYVVMRVAMVIQ
jgi:hypothetical protein